MDKTRELLIMHYHKYPKLQIQDIFKYLYQSSFGCEHLVSSFETAVKCISDEYESGIYESLPDAEPLDGAYSRVHLSWLDFGLRAETLGRLFCLSAKNENGKSDLIGKLTVARELVREGLLPFEEKQFDDAIGEWKADGYSSVHHSDVFRNEYKPCYRVIANEYIPFLPLFAQLDALIERERVNIAIEGGSASGKTTLSGVLSQIYDCAVFHTDDFFLRPEQRTEERFNEVGGNIDRERFLDEVLKPLSKNEVIVYRKFDCSSMTIKDGIQIKPEKLNVIEGAYSMHPEFAKYYDFSVFLDVCPKTQKERILKRNTTSLAVRFFNEWIPLESRYFSETRIKPND